VSCLLLSQELKGIIGNEIKIIPEVVNDIALFHQDNLNG